MVKKKGKYNKRFVEEDDFEHPTEEEDKKYRKGYWCLKYRNWVSEVFDDDLCVPVGEPICCECPHQAYNITEKGLPIAGMPAAFYWNDEYEITNRIKECPHGNLFVVGKTPDGIGWVRMEDEDWDFGIECDCTSPTGENKIKESELWKYVFYP